MLQDCDYCYQTLRFNSFAAHDRHLIKVKNYPHLTTCRDAKMRKNIPVSEKEAYNRRKNLRYAEEKIRYQANLPGHYDPDKDGTLEQYVKRLMDEKVKAMDKGHKDALKYYEKGRDTKRAWDAYRWDNSMIDPYTKMPIQDPVRNKICGHYFDKASIEEVVEKGKAEGVQVVCRGTFDMEKHLKYETNQTAWSGCINTIVNISDLEPHKELKAEIERRKAKRKDEVAENPKRRGELYKLAQSKRLAWGSDWNETSDPYKRKEYFP